MPYTSKRERIRLLRKTGKADKKSVSTKEQDIHLRNWTSTAMILNI